jgi:hypothetical protein
MSSEEITDFWHWFASRSNQIDEWLTNGAAKRVAQEMQGRMRGQFPRIGWEVGPGIKRRNFLAFTLNGDPNNIDLVTDILRSAPAISNWEFHAGRPRRAFDGRLIFRNERGQEVEIDLRDWRYVLTAFDDGRFFDIEVATTKRLRLDDRAKKQVLRTAVQTALGEMDALRYIDRLEFVDEPDKEWQERSTPFEYLAEHIDSLTASP